MHANDTKCLWQFISVKQKYLSNVIKLKIEHSLRLLVELRFVSLVHSGDRRRDIRNRIFIHLFSFDARTENFCEFIILINVNIVE